MNVKKKIGVLFGGKSPEYSVSLASGAAVLEHMDRERYEPLMLGITKEGAWFRYTGDPARIPGDDWYCPEVCTPVTADLGRSPGGLLARRGEELEPLSLDAVLPVLHGKNGEDGTVQGLFALLDIPVVGCGVLASALAMDKRAAHAMAEAAGVAVPRSVVLESWETPDRAAVLAEPLDYPLFVKPLRAGSSFGITRAEGREALLAAVALARRYDQQVILEECVTGVELGCAVLGGEHLRVGGPDMIRLGNDSGGFFDFSEKYHPQSAEILLPAPLDPAVAERARRTAETVYRALGCQGFARVDLFLTEAGELLLNEVNTIPGFTAHSRFPNMMRSAGLSFREVLTQAIEEALRP